MTDLARLVLGAPDAPTIVMLHGVTSSSFAQGEALLRWSELGYRVVAVDARGHGLSPRWTPAQLERAGEVLVEDAVSVLEEVAEEARARETVGLATAGAPVLVGHSMGGATAMVAAMRRPELVRGAVLEDPARYGTRSAEELRENGAERAKGQRSAADDPASAVQSALDMDDLPNLEAIPEAWSTARADEAHMRSGVVTPEVPWEDAMADLTVPTLVVTGDHPEDSRVGAQGIAVLERIGNANVETALVPGTGHLIRRAGPEGYYGAVDPFLERLFAGGE